MWWNATPFCAVVMGIIAVVKNFLYFSRFAPYAGILFMLAGDPTATCTTSPRHCARLPRATPCTALCLVERHGHRILPSPTLWRALGATATHVGVMTRVNDSR